MIRVIKVESDNFTGLATVDAYEELRLGMSSGDFGCHKATTVQVEDFTDVLTLEQILEAAEYCHSCGQFKGDKK